MEENYRDKRAFEELNLSWTWPIHRNEAGKDLWENGPQERRRHATKQRSVGQAKTEGHKEQVEQLDTYPVGAESSESGMKCGKNFYLERNDLAI